MKSAKFIVLFAALMALLTMPARVRGAEKFTVENKFPKFTVENRITPAKTTCNCSATGKCECWESRCACGTCGRAGGAVKEAPKAPSSAAVTGRVTIAPSVDAKDWKRESSVDTSPEGITTSAIPGIRLFPGGTTTGSGCENGNCPAPSRGGFIFRRR